MNPRMLSFRQVIEKEKRRWMPFRRALSKEDQEACDRMFADATQPLQTEVMIGRPGKFEEMLMAVVSVHAKRLEQVRMRLAAISAETHLPEGNPQREGP